MQAEELKKHLKELTEELLEVSAHIFAETATTYYKESFRRKGFDGRPWKPPKRPKSKGSLLVDSSALMNSIRPAVVTNERVVISAGNDKVTYAKAHNEGFVGSVNIPAHKRRSRASKGRSKENYCCPVNTFLLI